MRLEPPTAPADSGVCCPNCSSLRTPAKYTRRRRASTVRVRRCRDCNHCFVTAEKVTSRNAKVAV